MYFIGHGKDSEFRKASADAELAAIGTFTQSIVLRRCQNGGRLGKVPGIKPLAYKYAERLGDDWEVWHALSVPQPEYDLAVNRAKVTCE